MEGSEIGRHIGAESRRGARLVESYESPYGFLPLRQRFAATLAEREVINAGRKSIEEVARERELNAKYLGILWTTLNDAAPSLLLDPVRAQWRAA